MPTPDNPRRTWPPGKKGNQQRIVVASATGRKATVTSTVVVVRPHRTNYPDPVRFGKGQTLRLGEVDPDFPGWIRVVDPEGRSGWAPEAILRKLSERQAVAEEDYCARELDVSPQERLTVHRELAGWIWVGNEEGELGWVPADATRPLTP